MAYGNVVSYEPGPQPGSYAFQQANGSKFLAFGESAEDLRSRVDASAQNLASVQGNADITPQAVAANDPPSTALPASYEQESADRVAFANDATPVPEAANVSGGMSSQPAPGVASEANSSAAAPISSPASEPAGAAPVAHAHAGGGEGLPLFRDQKSKEIVYLVPGGDPKNPADLYTKTPASAPVKAGFSPHSMKVEGANTAATPADLQQLRGNEADQREAYKLSYDLHAQNLAEQRAAIDAQQSSLAVAQREQQERQQQMQAKADQLAQVYDAAKNDYANTRIDPERYQRGAVGIGNALAMGLGAYGAAITKSPNFAANLITQQTNNDIARQEAEMRIKGSAAQTALGDLNRQLGSLELAKTAYQGIQLQRAKGQLDLLANSTGTRDAAANYLQGSAQLDAALQANDLAFRQQALGHVSTDFRYHAASGGSAGARNPITMEQARTAYAVTPKVHVSAKSQEQQFAVQDSKDALHEAGAAVGLRWDPDKREFVGDASTLAGSEQWSTKALIKARHILGANAGTIAEAAGERKPPVGQIKDWVHDKLPGGIDTAENYKQFLSGAMRNAERKGRHTAVETTEADAPEREEAPE